MDVGKVTVKNKVPVLLVSALMLVSTSAMIGLVPAAASGEVSGSFTYQLINGGAEVEITGYTGSGGAVTVPGTIAGKTVTSIGGSAFYGITPITSVIVPDSVTSMGSYAFAYCSGLTSITLSEDLKSIGSWTFARCSALTYFTVPDGVTSIGYMAFNGCTALAHLDLGQGLKSIGDSAFVGCSALTSLDLPLSITSIATNAFRGCSALTSVELSDRVTSIGTYSFAECTSLTSIGVAGTNPNYASVDGVLYNKGLTTLLQYPGGKPGAFTVPESVTRIDNGAFSHSTSLTLVTIGYKVTWMDYGSFYYCQALTAIQVDGDNPNYASVDGVLYDKGLTTLIQYPGRRNGPFTVPTSVTNLASSSFAGSSGLTSLTIPDGAALHMGESTFRYCTSLVSVEMGDDVIGLGSSAFAYCTSLFSLRLGEGLTAIDANAFLGCSSLTCVTVPGGVSSIGSSAFGSCTSLSTVVVGDHVAYFDQWAFSGCTALTTMIFNGNAPSVSSYWNQDCRWLTAFYHEGATGFSTPSWNGAACYLLGSTPTAPNGLAVTLVNGGVTLSWAAPTYAGGSDIDHYVIYQDGAEVMNVTGASGTVEGLTCGQDYEFRAAAHNADGVGQASSPLRIKPSNLTITSPNAAYLSTDTIALVWSFDGDRHDVDHFTIELNGNASEVSAQGSSYMLRNMPEGVQTVKVSAVGSDGRTLGDEVTFVVDTIDPTVTDRSPSGKEVSTMATVSATFSEAMDESSVSFIIGGVSGTLSWSGSTVTFQPSSVLQGNTEHSVTVSCKDLAGHRMVVAWTFTTANVGSISGTITDQDGKPLPGSTVTLKGTAGTTLTTVTGSSGGYAFHDVPVGGYDVLFEGNGYETVTQHLEVTSDTVASGGTTVNGTLSVKGSGDTIMLIMGGVAVTTVAVLSAVLFLRHRDHRGKR